MAPETTKSFIAVDNMENGTNNILGDVTHDKESTIFCTFAIFDVIMNFEPFGST